MLIETTPTSTRPQLFPRFTNANSEQVRKSLVAREINRYYCKQFTPARRGKQQVGTCRAKLFLAAILTTADILSLDRHFMQVSRIACAFNCEPDLMWFA